MAPGDTPPLQFEGNHRRRCRRQRVEGAVPVGDERIVQCSIRPDGSAGTVGRFDDDDVPPRIGQPVRSDKAVVAGTDDHGVDVHGLGLPGPAADLTTATA